LFAVGIDIGVGADESEFLDAEEDEAQIVSGAFRGLGQRPGRGEGGDQSGDRVAGALGDVVAVVMGADDQGFGTVAAAF